MSRATKGTSLVEVVVAAALGAVVLGGVAYALRGALRAEREYSRSLEFDSLVESVILIVSSHELCNGAFVTSDHLHPVALDHIPTLSHPVLVGSILMGAKTAGGGWEVANTQSTPNESMLKVQSIAFIQALDQGPNDAGQPQYLATLRIAAIKSEHGESEVSFMRDFYVPITTDPATHEILACGVGNDSSGFKGSMTEFTIDQSHMAPYGDETSPNPPTEYHFADSSYKICVLSGLRYIPSAANTDVGTVTSREHWIVKNASGFSLRSRIRTLANPNQVPHEAKVKVQCFK